MHLDFNTTVYLRIGGEIGKNNSLPLEYFAELASCLQSLINDIAKNDLSAEEAIAMKNFRLDLVDFKTGGAIPGFSFVQNPLPTVSGDPMNQRKQISERFDSLMQLAHTGNYLELKKLYPDSVRRNSMVKSLYSFIGALKTPKASFVSCNKEEIETIYKLRKFSKEIRDSLIVNIIEDTIHENSTEFKYGRVKVTRSNGKERKTIKEVYNSENTKITHVFNFIKTENKIYQLKAPLMCTLEKEGDGFMIESEMVRVIGIGDSRETAIADFCREFDYLYKKLQSLKFDELSEKMRVSKTFFAVLIGSIT